MLKPPPPRLPGRAGEEPFDDVAAPLKPPCRTAAAHRHHAFQGGPGRNLSTTLQRPSNHPAAPLPHTATTPSRAGRGGTFRRRCSAPQTTLPHRCRTPPPRLPGRAGEEPFDDVAAPLKPPCRTAAAHRHHAFQGGPGRNLSTTLQRPSNHPAAPLPHTATTPSRAGRGGTFRRRCSAPQTTLPHRCRTPPPRLPGRAGEEPFDDVAAPLKPPCRTAAAHRHHAFQGGPGRNLSTTLQRPSNHPAAPLPHTATTPSRAGRGGTFRRRCSATPTRPGPKISRSAQACGLCSRAHCQGRFDIFHFRGWSRASSRAARRARSAGRWSPCP